MAERTVRGDLNIENSNVIIETVSSTIKRIWEKLPDGSTTMIEIDTSDPNKKIINKKVTRKA